MSDHEEVEPMDIPAPCFGCGVRADDQIDGYCGECREAGVSDGEKQDAIWRANNPS